MKAKGFEDNLCIKIKKEITCQFLINIPSVFIFLINESNKHACPRHMEQIL